MRKLLLAFSGVLTLAVLLAGAPALAKDQSCKKKYPAYASYMETRWKSCQKAPSQRTDPAQADAWRCWCRR